MKTLELETGLTTHQVDKLPLYVLDAMHGLNRDLNKVRAQLAALEGIKPVEDRFGSYRVEGIHVFHDYDQYIYPLTDGSGMATLVDKYGAALSIRTQESPLGHSGFRIDWDTNGNTPPLAILPNATNSIDLVERIY